MIIFKNTFAIVFMFLALFIFYDYISNENIDFLNFGNEDKESSEDKVVFPLGQLILSATAMLFGIFFGSVYDAIKSKTDEEEISLFVEVIKVTKKKRFLSAILVSPVIFIGIYMAAKTQPDQVIATLLAFQNGFFCDAIMKKEK